MNLIKRFLIWRNGICEKCNKEPKSFLSSGYCEKCIDKMIIENKT